MKLKNWFTKKKFKGGALWLIGFILSPLSRRNDLLVNFPLAYWFARVFSFWREDLFLPMLVLWYWITNVLWFVLMHHWFQDVTSKDEEIKKYTKKELKKDIIISILYTILIIIVIQLWRIKVPDSFYS